MHRRTLLAVLVLLALAGAGVRAWPASAASGDIVFEGVSGSSPWVDVVTPSELAAAVPAIAAVGSLDSIGAGSCSSGGFMSSLRFTGAKGETTVTAATLATSLGWPGSDVLIAAFEGDDLPGCWAAVDPIVESRRLRVAQITISDAAGGDGDGFAECGETLQIGISVASVTETLNAPRIVVSVLGPEASLDGTSWSDLGTLAPGVTAAAPGRFSVVVDDAVSGYDWVTLVVTVGNDARIFEGHRHIPLGCGRSGSATASPSIVFPVAGPNTFSREWLTTHNPSIHEGTDVRASRMVPILAAADGVIADVNWDHDPYHDGPGECCALAIVHDSGWESWYLHLNNDTPGTDDGAGWGIVPGLKRGDRVSAGQIIGWVGDSTNAETTAPHLHFEVHDPAGNPVDPYDLLRSASTVTPICTVSEDVCFPFVILSWNSRDPSVAVLQSRLAAAGFSPGAADGIFGNRTDFQLRLFQRAAGLGVDGLVDRETWDELKRVVDQGIHLVAGVVARRGDRGPAVLEIQNLLAARGFSPGPIDGIFGGQTETATSRFQSDRGIAATGVVDQTTLERLRQTPAADPAPPTTPTTPTTSPVLRIGDRGTLVAELQRLLGTAGYPTGATDGIFGALTDRAVRSFQSALRLVVDGIVGDSTWSALGGSAQRVVVAKRGDSGEAVRQVQVLLQAAGYSPGPIDGIFGSRTETAVRSFQSASGLAVDGQVDEPTLTALR